MPFPTSQPSSAPATHQIVVDEVRAIADVVGYTMVTKTTTYTAVKGDFVLADLAGGSWTLTLPAVAGKARVAVKKISTGPNVLTIVPVSGTIDGDTSLTIVDPYAGCYLESNGTNWYVVGVF